MQISQNIELFVFIAKLGFLSSPRDLISYTFLSSTYVPQKLTLSENSLTTVCSSVFLVSRRYVIITLLAIQVVFNWSEWFLTIYNYGNKTKKTKRKDESVEMQKRLEERI